VEVDLMSNLRSFFYRNRRVLYMVVLVVIVVSVMPNVFAADGDELIEKINFFEDIIVKILLRIILAAITVGFLLSVGIILFSSSDEWIGKAKKHLGKLAVGALLYVTYEIIIGLLTK
jgi:hypothetical protein